MTRYRPGDQPAATAPESTFTGDVGIEGYFRRETPSRLAGAIVSYPPGARTPWKTNPAGQTIVVTHGSGRAQVEGEPVVELRAGDLLWSPPGSRHWDGASPTESMTCVILQECIEGRDVEFLDVVSDDQYAGPVDA